LKTGVYYCFEYLFLQRNGLVLDAVIAQVGSIIKSGAGFCVSGDWAWIGLAQNQDTFNKGRHTLCRLSQHITMLLYMHEMAIII